MYVKLLNDEKVRLSAGAEVCKAHANDEVSGIEEVCRVDAVAALSTEVDDCEEELELAGACADAAPIVAANSRATDIFGSTSLSLRGGGRTCVVWADGTLLCELHRFACPCFAVHCKDAMPEA